MNTLYNVFLASNILHAISNAEWNTDHSDSDFIDNNAFLVNTDSESDLQRESATGDKKRNNLESDVLGSINLRREYPSRPKIGYLTTNSLSNKINYIFVKCFLNAQLI